MNEHQWERALETGHRNRGIIELAHHHCTRMQFRYSGGHGLAEAETGLPIDMREIYCEVGGHGSMASNLELIAGNYVREHCRDCPSRAPTGRMPNLLTVVWMPQMQSTSRSVGSTKRWRRRRRCRHGGGVPLGRR